MSLITLAFSSVESVEVRKFIASGEDLSSFIPSCTARYKPKIICCAKQLIFSVQIIKSFKLL